MQMNKGTLLAIAILALASSAASAGDVGRFDWKRGQVIQYKAENTTLVVESSPDGKQEMNSKTAQTRRWEVQEVDAQGIATIQLSLTHLAVQQSLPGGRSIAYDSANPDRSDPQLAKQLAVFVGKPLATLRVDPYGRVVEVKSSMQGPTTRWESELPFGVVVPGVEFQTGQRWKRDYNLVLDPPLGAGQKFAAEQAYQVKSAAAGQAVIAITTTIKEPPRDPTDLMPLLQFQPQGEAVFDGKRGLVTSVRVSSGGVVDGHNGEGSRYEFKSTYQETLVGN